MTNWIYDLLTVSKVVEHFKTKTPFDWTEFVEKGKSILSHDDCGMKLAQQQQFLSS